MQHPFLESIKSNVFLVLGRAGVDFYPHPPGTRTEDGATFTAALGGSSANISVALIKLGGAASLVTCVSDDALGRLALNLLKGYGVDTQYVRSVGGQARTSLAVVESRVEEHQSVIYRNGAADFEMNQEDIRAIDYRRYGGLILTGTALASEPSRSACFRALALAKSAGLATIFDVDHRPYSWSSAQETAEIYRQAASQSTVVVGNEDEFSLMVHEQNQALSYAQELAQTTAALVVYKRGEKGSRTFTKTGSFSMGIFATQALKPTGAGDAFMGGLLSALAQGQQAEDAVRWGSACAALVVARVGCAPAMPFAQEVQELIETSRLTATD